MKLHLLNTSQGLKPCYDEDYDKKRKLKIGETYEVRIRVVRNLKFHRKYFALINCAWEYQNEAVVGHFKNNIELFRKSVEVAAGHCDMIYSIERREWIEQAKSIAFDKLSETEFQEIYSRVLDLLLRVFLRGISREEFEQNIASFL